MNMRKRNNLKKILFVMITLFLMNFLVFNNTYAYQTEEITFCVSQEVYNDWQKLSDEEKEKNPIPEVCSNERKITVSDITIDFHSYFNAKTEIPSKYDPRTDGDTVAVKNQMQTGTCWAQSTTSMLELYSKKLLNLNYTFSPRHIEYTSVRNFLNDKINENGYNKTLGEGGNFLMSSNYLMNNYGPISEEDMPFENNEELIDISKIQNKRQLLDVNNIILYNDKPGYSCTTTEISDIKKYILEKGSVSVGIYMSTTENYYNEETAAYSYIGSNVMDHIVTIVGWDDDYAIDNFNAQNKPLSKGAWIVQNSWGTNWGDNGYFYISYTDSNVCKNYMVIDSVDTTIEDNIYSYDKLGMNGQVGFSTGRTGYAMNVFSKEAGSEEILKEVTFGNYGKGTYKIYYLPSNGEKTKISEMQEIGSGTLNYKGYVTHKLTNELIIGEDVTDFSIVVYYQMSSVKQMIPVSSASVAKYEYMTVPENRSFISSTGSTWTNLTTKYEDTTVVSIKVTTDDVVDDNIYEFDEEKLLVYVPDETSLEDFKTNVNAATKDVYKDDVAVTEGNVGTGMEYNNYSIIVKGDVTGDGKVRMNDVMMISKYIVEETGIEGEAYLIASDVTNEGNIRMNDVMMISKYIVEGGSL